MIIQPRSNPHLTIDISTSEGESARAFAPLSANDHNENEIVGGKKSPLRRCIVTGTIDQNTCMIRFVVDPTGHIIPDVDARLPGRGYWVLARKNTLQKAIESKIFPRAVRHSVQVNPDLITLTKDILEQRCVGLLNLARRGGLIVSGFDAVAETLRQKKSSVALILTASDASANANEKICALGQNLPIVTVFNGATLGHIFNRDKVIHGALFKSALADKFRTEIQRYQGLVSDPLSFSPSMTMDEKNPHDQR